MKQQLVDPFIPAPGQLARSQAAEVARQRMSTPKLKNHNGSIDGVVHVGSAASKMAQTPRRPYRGPAASLHLQYAQPTQLTPPSTSRRSRRPQPNPTAAPTPISQSNAKTKARAKPKKEGVSTLWLLAGAAIAGLALFSVMAGQVAIAVYGIVALWRRWPSQQNFALALVMFGGIIIASLVPAFQTVANNLAVYAFLLLCIGTLSLAREVRRDTRQTASERR